MTDNHEQIVNLLNALTDKEAADSNFEMLVRSIISRKRRDWNLSEEYAAEQRAIRDENERKRLARISKEREMEKWVVDNLKPGMMVTMNGTRDGHGLRRVIRVDQGDVICRQMRPISPKYATNVLYRGVVQIGKGYWQVQDNITTHGAGKVKRVFNEDEYKVLSVSDD